MLQDLDAALRGLVEREIGTDIDVEIDFDAPTKEWASRRNAPTIDIYLYDIRQDVTRSQFGEIVERDGDGVITARRPPPKFFRVAYLVTAWTQRAEDEHRLLSALMAAFLKHEVVPADLLGGSLSELGISIPLAVALPPPQDRSLSDVWSALGGELKPSLDLSLIAPLLPDRVAQAGPPVTKEPTISMTDRRGGTAEAQGGRTVPDDRRPGQDERRRPAPSDASHRSRQRASTRR
jgi:hypothetical protein